MRTAGLEVIESLINESGKLLAPCSTRWLSTEWSVNRLKKCFVSVVLSLQREGEERSDAKAVGLNNLVTEYRFVCTMLLLCDALPHVSHLSKCFQITDCDYSIIPRMVTSTVHAIKQLKTVDGVNMKGLQELIPWADFKFRYISKSKSQHIKVMSTSKYLLKIPIWIDWLVILKLDLRINLSWLLLMSIILPNCHTCLIIHAL